MRIAIATDADQVAAHFGRCEAYTVVDVEDGEAKSRELVTNPGHQPGALPKLMQQIGVTVVICGGAGPRAQGLMADAGIELIQGVACSVDEALAAYLDGTLESGSSACHH